MWQLRQLVIALAILVVLTFAASFLVVSGLYVFAAVAPILGLAYAVACGRKGIELWRSHGRFQLPDGMRIIAAGRARLVGVLAMTQGVGVFMLSLIPAAIAFGPQTAIIPLLASGLALEVVARVMRRQVMAGAHAVDVLPPRD